MTKPTKDAAKRFEDALKRREQVSYVLRLYVSGTTPRSVRAIANIKQICEKHLKGRFELEVIDSYQKPDLARRDQVVALPTLVKELPTPLRRIIGDLSDTEKVLVGLDLVEKDQDSSA